MTLGEARRSFSYALATAVLYAHDQLGLGVAFDEVMVHLTEKNPTGNHMVGSVHYQGLGADLLLYRLGVYLTDTKDYQELGEYWEQLGKDTGLPLAWGGRFSHADGNHFSMSWGGKS